MHDNARFAVALILISGVCGCAGGSASPGSQSQPPAATVQAKPGQTVKEVVDSLPQRGGTVILGLGTWLSGYDSSSAINRADITIQGSGKAGYNPAFTAMSGGTIIQGTLPSTTGADHLTVRDLGVDVGSDYINAKNEGVALDGLAIYNGGQVVGAPPVQSPVVENVSCLGSAPMAPVHCMLLENVTDAVVTNVTTVLNMHGFVLKGTHSVVGGISSRGHGIDSIILKSDDYAPTSFDQIGNVTVRYLFSPGDTKGIVIQGVERGIDNITLHDATIEGIVGWGVYVQGAGSQSPATNILLKDITVDYPGSSPISDYCMQFVQYVSSVSIDNLQCSNMWAGIAPYLPSQDFFADFHVTNSHFSGIATNGIQTFGSWSVAGSTFDSIGGDGILNTYGVTAVASDTFTNIGGTNLGEDGGTFTVTL
jgi:hypothetical protein